MKIVFDIMHPAHINFLKNSMYAFKNNGHEVYITVLDRGKLLQIVKKELVDFDIQIIGKHKGTKLSIIFSANLFRFFKMFAYLLKIKPDIGISVGSFILGANLKLRRKPNYQFDDDPERPVNVFLEKLTSTKLFFPKIYHTTSAKVELINTLKEWSYLSPKYFSPNMASIIEYDLKPNEYIFVREISTGSLNYSSQQSNFVASFSKQFPKGTKVVLSLEDKKSQGLYPKDWILLKEPVKDIHSLIYYSKLIVSSGDSMAREGAMLGVPAIYCGHRSMKANQILENKGIIFHLQENIPSKINELNSSDEFLKNKDQFRKSILDEWIDVNDFIKKLILKHKK